MNLKIYELEDGAFNLACVVASDWSLSGKPNTCQVVRDFIERKREEGLSGHDLWRRVERAFSNGYMMAELESDDLPNKSRHD
jgi:hypothetical protein